MPRQSDLLLACGGEELERTGVFLRKVAPISHGGEEWQETHTRADATTVASYLDRDANVRRALADVLRPDWWELDSGAGRVACSLHEEQRENLAVQAEDLRTASGWTNGGVGNLVVTNNYATHANLPFNRLTTLTNNTLFRTVTFTGGGSLRAFALYVRNDGGAASFDCGIWDNTASVWRLRLRVTISAAGVVTAVATDGTLIKVEPVMAGSVYRVLGQATGVVVGNTNHCYAFSDVSGTSLLLTGAQVENYSYPSSYIKTTGSAVTRAPDRTELSFIPHPQAMTLYAKFRELAHPPFEQDGGENARIVQIGASANSDPRLYLFKDHGGSDNYRLSLVGPTGVGLLAFLDLNPAYGDTIELRGVLNTDTSIQLHGAKNGGTESSGSLVAGFSDAFGSLTAWSAPTLASVGAIGTAGRGSIVLRSLKIARGGPWSLGEMRTL